jgi:RNA-binding protein
MTMTLTDRQKKHLRRLGHALHPVVLIGQRGLTGSVAAELARALHDHELVKVRARVGDRAARDAVFAELARVTGAALVNRIGNVCLFYKQNNELNRILLPAS